MVTKTIRHVLHAEWRIFTVNGDVVKHIPHLSLLAMPRVETRGSEKEKGSKQSN